MVPTGTNARWSSVIRRAQASADQEAPTSSMSARDRILHAAMEAFITHGYSLTSTLDIARAAKTSKRELYALFGSKQAMLEACIAERATRMRLSPELPRASSRLMLASLLTQFGAILLREVTNRDVVAVYRLAISEAIRSPEVARTLEQAGQNAGRAALKAILRQAQSSGLIGPGHMPDMIREYLGLLWGDLLMGSLLRVREAPKAPEIRRRAKRAAEAFLLLYPARV